MVEAGWLRDRSKVGLRGRQHHAAASEKQGAALVLDKGRASPSASL